MEIRHQNSYGMMRWVFALFVVYSHAFALTGHSGHGDLIAKYTGHAVSDFGVVGFFVLSGFLNAGSLQRTPTPVGGVSFLIRRAFRIFPLLWVMLAVAVLASWVLAPSPPGALNGRMSYFFGNGFLYLPHWSLPGLFENNPNKAFCGSLWTLPYEAFFYTLLVATGLGQAKGCDWLNKATLAAMIGLLCFTASPAAPPVFGGIQLYYIGYLGISFLCGIAIRKFPAHLASRKMALACAVFLPLSYMIPGEGIAAWSLLQVFAFAVVVMKLGSRTWGAPSVWMGRHDASYGIYLLSFPIQQVLVALGQTHPYQMFFTSALLSTGVGLVSWHFLEKPMLGIGKKLSRSVETLSN